MTTPQRLAQFVQPNLHEARLSHQWAKITNASRFRARFVWPRFVPVFAASMVLCGALVVGWRWFNAQRSAALNGTIVESNESGAQVLTLPDGSRIELAVASRLVVDAYEAGRVQVTLKQGTAEFEVAHQAGRQFAVFAGGFAISVLGTHFTVTLGPASAPERVTVQVERGKVSVRNRQSTPDERVLAAGQSWSAAGGVEPSMVQNATESTSGAAAQEPPAEGEASDKNQPLAPQPSTAAIGASGNANKSATEAKDLFEAAQLSRISGNLRESADALNRLRKSYRSDPRAGLAAFELGRMRMDIFGDVLSSIDAFRDAIKLSPMAPFREDAEARLVQLYHRQDDRRCESAKAQYLEHYPNGAARKLVSRLCVR